eukprot:3936031-Rhodomonas_salina.3
MSGYMTTATLTSETWHVKNFRCGTSPILVLPHAPDGKEQGPQWSRSNDIHILSGLEQVRAATAGRGVTNQAMAVMTTGHARAGGFGTTRSHGWPSTQDLGWNVQRRESSPPAQLPGPCPVMCVPQGQARAFVGSEGGTGWCGSVDSLRGAQSFTVVNSK